MFNKVIKSILLTGLFFKLGLVQAAPLTIHAADFESGKFHRYSQGIHPYGPGHAWKVFILPAGLNPQKTFSQKNEDGSFTVFFDTLEDLFREVIALSRANHEKVGILNLNAHGQPGGIFVPLNQKIATSEECNSWRNMMTGTDAQSYDQYYRHPDDQAFELIQRLAKVKVLPKGHCTSGFREWKELPGNLAEVKNLFSPDAQVHILSCLTGMGRAGENLTRGIAESLFAAGNQRVETAVKFGLGDWSMNEGMGFWYPDSRLSIALADSLRDRDEMQEADLRVAQMTPSGEVRMGWVRRQQFMRFTEDPGPVEFDK